MELGLVIPHTGPGADPAHIERFCTLAESLGFHRLWAVDHVVLPHHVESRYPLGRVPTAVADGEIGELLAPNFELIATLAWVAAMTDRIGLGTSVTVLPLRNPLLNARQLATVDRLSGGRLVCGVGVGWLEEEARALGMPWTDRGVRADEHIALLRRCWTPDGDLVSFDGERYAFPEIHAEPRPHQPRIPILVGGHSTVARRRAVRLGDGWIAAPMSPSALGPHVAELHRMAEDAGRDPAELAVVASTRAGGTVPSADVVAAYRDVGVDHLQIELGATRGPQELALVEAIAEAHLPSA